VWPVQCGARSIGLSWPVVAVRPASTPPRAFNGDRTTGHLSVRQMASQASGTRCGSWNPATLWFAVRDPRSMIDIVKILLYSALRSLGKRGYDAEGGQAA
jgi:hypothetical protein